MSANFQIFNRFQAIFAKYYILPDERIRFPIKNQR